MKTLILFAQNVNSSDFKIPQNTDVNNGTFVSILNIVFPIIGSIALIVLVVAGFRYVMSRGNPKATAEAKNAIIYAAIGLVVTILSYSIVSFVVNKVNSVANSTIPSTSGMVFMIEAESENAASYHVLDSSRQDGQIIKRFSEGTAVS